MLPRTIALREVKDIARSQISVLVLKPYDRNWN